MRKVHCIGLKCDAEIVDMYMTNNGPYWLERSANQIVIIILFFATGFAFGYVYHVYKSNEALLQYSSDIAMEEATYLRLVHIGSSGCGFSNNEITIKMVRELKDYFYSFAHQNDYKFNFRSC